MTQKNRYEKKCKAKTLNLRDVSKTPRNILYLIKYPVQTCTTAIDPKMLRDNWPTDEWKWTKETLRCLILMVWIDIMNIHHLFCQNSILILRILYINSWYSYKMVATNMLRTCKGKQFASNQICDSCWSKQMP